MFMQRMITRPPSCRWISLMEGPQPRHGEYGGRTLASHQYRTSPIKVQSSITALSSDTNFPLIYLHPLEIVQRARQKVAVFGFRCQHALTARDSGHVCCQNPAPRCKPLKTLRSIPGDTACRKVAACPVFRVFVHSVQGRWNVSQGESWRGVFIVCNRRLFHDQCS